MSKLVTIKVEEATRQKAKIYAAQNKEAVYKVVADAIDKFVSVT